MAARENDIVADEMKDEEYDQTGENSAGHVSNSENTFKPLVILKLRNALKIKRDLPDTPTFNCQLSGLV